MNDDSNLCVQTSCPLGLEHMVVHELINESSGTWDVDLIRVLVEPNDVDCIIKTSLPPREVKDRLI